MPNYCENDLYVEGKEKDLEGFLAFAKGTDGTNELLFDFARFVPEPSTKKDDWDWYHWRIDNWGTKWNADRVQIEPLGHSYLWDEEAGVKICFDTAWSPPTPVILAAAHQFPMLCFRLEYFECGMAFHGCFICENGEMTQEFCGEYFGSRGG
jgi:hypothetical protein